jgi:hypothetical protein
VAEIRIEGDDAAVAANGIVAAIQEIFEIEPIRYDIRNGITPGSRALMETVALVIVALPPAITATQDLIVRTRLGERLQRFIARVSALRSRAGILIDPGDGTLIPLENASAEAIVQALNAVEQQLKP